MRKIIKILLIITVTNNICFGQDDSNVSNVNIMPPSPTASALGEYIDFPVSHYTGIPEIQIPFYTIKQKELSIPVTISYHAKGNKVEDIASWVGLGWSLNAGGLITRSVQGLPDDGFHYLEVYENDFTGYYHENQNEYRTGLFQNGNITNYISSGIFNGVRNQTIDTQPDYFYVNCLNLNFKFAFDKDENVHLIPQSDIVITKEMDSNGSITAFTVIDARGIKYYFNKAEESKTIVTFPNWKVPEKKDIYTKTYNSSWLLGSVTDAKGNVINFEYDDEEITYEQRGHKKYYYRCEYGYTVWFTEYNEVEYVVETKKLRSINWNGGTVRFTRGLNREDLTGAKALTDISVYNLRNEFVKGYSLSYSHFVTNGINEAIGKRLKLESVQEYGESTTKPSYIFHYNTKQLPSRLSISQDYWGYYNSNVTQSKTKTYYYPDYYDETLRSQHCIFPLKTYTGTEEFIDGADRNCNEDDIFACLLEKVDYPTGGYSQFNYELHEFQNPDNLFDLGSNIKGGGIRIESITHSEDGSQFIEKKYHYELSSDASTTSGKIAQLPQYAKNWTSGLSCDPEDFPSQISFETHSLSGLGTTHGSHVGYTEVKEEITGNGYTWYKYKMPGAFGVDEDVYVDGSPIYTRSEMKIYDYQVSTFCNNPPTYFTRDCEISQPYPPNSNLDWYRGLLEEVTVYDNTSNKVQKTVNTYKIKAVEKISSVFSQKEGSMTLYCGQGSSRRSKTRYSYFFAEYDIISPWVVQSSVTKYTYNSQDDTKYNSKATNYKYEGSGHKQLTSIITSDSNGEELKTEFKYPVSFPNDLVTYSMANSVNNLMNYPIETIQYKNNKVITSTINRFGCYDCVMNPQGFLFGGNFMLNKTYKLETNVPLSNYQEVTSNFTIDSRCKEQINIDAYDNYGNILQYHKINDNNQSFIWGYGRQYPIAKVENAVSNETFFTSFEGEEEDLMSLVIDDCVTTRSYSGDRSLEYTLSNPSQSIWERRYEVFKLKPVISGLPKRYRYSGWVYSNGPKAVVSLYFKKANGVYNSVGNANTTVTNQWIYVEGEYTLPATFDGSTVTDLTLWVYGSDNSGKIWFDDLRLYPADAQMTSYTYDPLVGMTSQTGPDNKKATYIYDDFGRLEFVKDHHGNVINKYTYHYKGEPVNEFTEDFVDLSVSRITCPTAVNDNETTIDVDVSIRNSGNLVSNACKLYIYISDDANLDAGDIKLAEQDVGTLINAYDRGYIINLTLPANLSLGTHYIIAKIDADNQNDESNEANNTMAGQFNYVETPSAILAVNKSAIIFRNGVYSTTFNITSNVNWTILSSTWLTLSSNSGSNNQTITVSGNEVLGDQTGTITISGGGITRTINVTQIGDPGGPGDPLQIE